MGLNDNLVGLYHFTGNANDSSGNGNNGTVNGATLTTDKNGVSNQAYDFDGTNDYIRVTHSSDFATNTWSMCGWINADAGQSGVQGYPVFKDQGGINQGDWSLLWQNTDRLQFRVQNVSSTGLAETIPLNTSQWYHFVMTYNGSLMELYLDGVLVDTASITATTSSNTLPLDFGGWGGTGTYFNGQLDEFRFYDRVIGQQEVLELYEGYDTDADHVGTLETGLVAGYHFTGNANDFSPNSNDGTVNGATLTSDKNGNLNSAYDFDNSLDDRIDVSTAIIASATTDSWSISAWFKLATPSVTATIAQGVDSAGTDIMNLQYITSGSIRFQSRDSGGSATFIDVPFTNDNQWHHVALCFDNPNNTHKCYIDGVEVGTFSRTDVKVIDRMVIGNDKNLGNSLQGDGDEYRFYNRVLTSFEIQQLYQGYDVDESCEPLLGPQENQVATGINTGLIAGYSFSGNADDFSGNGNNGTVTGATLTTDRNGQNNRAYDFDGTNDYMSLGNPYEINSNDYSISLWVNWGVFGGDGIISNVDSNPSANKVIIYDNGSNKVRHLTKDSTQQIHDSSANLSTGTWYHIVVTRAGNISKIYIDGKLDSTGTAASGDLSSGENWNLGNFDTTGTTAGYFDGKLDEVRIYDRVLKPTDVKALYQNYDAQDNDLPLDESSLVAYYPFTGNALDASVNGNNGTVNGATLTTDRNSVVNQAYSFDGVNDYIDTNISGFNPTDGSISFWFKADDVASTVRFLLSDRSSTGEYLHIAFQNSNIDARIFSGANNEALGTTTLSTGVWYNYVLTWGVGGMNAYLNAVPEASNSYTGAWTSNSNFEIGRAASLPSTNYYDGVIDEVRFYNRALTQHEIEELYFGYDEPSVCPVAPTPPQPGVANNAPFFGGGL